MIDTQEFLAFIDEQRVDVSTLGTHGLLELLIEHAADVAAARVGARAAGREDIVSRLRVTLTGDPGVERMLAEVLLHLQNR